VASDNGGGGSMTLFLPIFHCRKLRYRPRLRLRQKISIGDFLSLKRVLDDYSEGRVVRIFLGPVLFTVMIDEVNPCE
jgi:hypothetical protein